VTLTTLFPPGTFNPFLPPSECPGHLAHDLDGRIVNASGPRPNIKQALAGVDLQLGENVQKLEARLEVLIVFGDHMRECSCEKEVAGYAQIHRYLDNKP
jgi:hypothetical protein